MKFNIIILEETIEKEVVLMNKVKNVTIVNKAEYCFKTTCVNNY